MRPIPLKQREEMSQDPYYKTCCLALDNLCLGKVEWHHNMIYAGRQVNDRETILPLCNRHHKLADNKYIKEKLNWIMLSRMSYEQKIKYSKATRYDEMYETLKKIYGNYTTPKAS